MIKIEVQHGVLEVGGRFMPWIDDGAKREFVADDPVDDQEFAQGLAQRAAQAERVRILNQEFRQVLWGDSSGFLTLHQWRIVNQLTEIIDAIADDNGEALDSSLQSLVSYVEASHCYTPSELNFALQQGVEL
jgi:hypothetical protein